jgi:hypothetical protein
MPVLILLFAVLPKPNRGSKIIHQTGYVSFYYGLQKKVVAWHQAELKKLDPVYEIQQASIQLVAARKKAYRNGVSPMDPKYPILADFLSK